MLDEPAGGAAAQQRLAAAVRATSVALASELGARFSAAAQVRSRTAEAEARLESGEEPDAEARKKKRIAIEIAAEESFLKDLQARRAAAASDTDKLPLDTDNL